jgi:broad specificity phosphatase PhoE
MTTLLLARHGQTDWNLEHRWQGDPPLNDFGRNQACSLAQSISAKLFDGLYSSDLVRARETAAIIAKHLRLSVRLDSRLREIDVGEWAGLTSPELEQRYPIGFQRHLEGGVGWKQGESYEAMVARVTAAIHSIAAAHPGGQVLVVTHAGVLCSAWLASGGKLADWQGTHNGDVHEVVAENDQIRWVGMAQSAEEDDQSTPSIFWRV